MPTKDVSQFERDLTLHIRRAVLALEACEDETGRAARWPGQYQYNLGFVRGMACVIRRIMKTPNKIPQREKLARLIRQMTGYLD